MASSQRHSLTQSLRTSNSSELPSNSSRQRLPYHYDSELVSNENTSTESTSNRFSTQENMNIRYRLFSRLDPGGKSLLMPDHIVPDEFFSILPFNEFTDESGKQNSFVTIFSIWNTMMGTSLLAMPWALYQSGMALGLTLMLSMAALSLYTAFRVVQSPEGLGWTLREIIDMKWNFLISPYFSLEVTNVAGLVPDFQDVCGHFWGRKGELFALAFSISVLLGGVVVYWVLMSNFLYYTGSVIYDAIQPNSSEMRRMLNKSLTCDVFCPNQSTIEHQGSIFNKSSHFYDYYWKLQGTVPIYLAFITFPLLNFKSPTIFTKFNILGTISVIYLLVFTFSKIMECGINVEFWPKNDKIENQVELLNWNFPALTGTMALSYFIHNCVLNILRNQKNPQNNVRDLTIAYVLVSFCYIFIGLGFFLAFPTFKRCIADNFLNNFGTGDVLSATARLFLLLQMIAILPLLVYLIRVQLSYAISGLIYPGFAWVCLINIVVIAIGVLFAAIYPHIGGIIRFVGSFSGLVYIFALPCIVHLKRLDFFDDKISLLQYAIHFAIIAFGVLNLFGQFVIN